MRAARRFPDRVFGVGSEPDPRFTLANERTFLAWIRTALAMMAAGVALEVVDLGLQPELRLAASLVLVVGGMLLPAQAWLGWCSTERALRCGRPLPAPTSALPTAVVVLAAGVLVALAVLDDDHRRSHLRSRPAARTHGTRLALHLLVPGRWSPARQLSSRCS